MAPAMDDERALNLTAPSQVRALLQRFGLSPDRRLGQHFLVDRNILHKVLEAAELRPEDRVLEVGPGLGTLTRELAARVGRVVAVEIDRRLRPVLGATLADYPNVQVIYGDIISADLSLLCAEAGETAGGWKVVANLPYYVTGPVVARLLEFGHETPPDGAPFALLVVMVQHEVARRMVAPPGGKDYGGFTLLVNYYASPELVARVPAAAFLPPPEVGSAIVRMRPREHPPIPAGREQFFAVVKAAFGQRRKSLRNALAAGLPDGEAVAAAVLRLAGIDGGRRGETLTMEEFGALAAAFEQIAGGSGGQLA